MFNEEMFTDNRNWLFLSLVSLFFLILGQTLGGRQGLLLGFFVATSLNLYIYFISEKLLINFFKANLLEGQDPWGITTSIQEASEYFRAQKPQVYITKQDSPIICCTSRGWGHSKIIISECLLERLSYEEIQNILLIHILYTLSLNSFFVGFRTQFAEIVYIVSRFLDTLLTIPFMFSEHNVRVVFFQKIFSPVGTLFFRSQKKFLLDADEKIAKHIGSHVKYANLIWKLQSLIQTKPFPAPPSPSVLFVINPLTTDGLDKYFQKHYELDVRIQKLTGHYPL